MQRSIERQLLTWVLGALIFGALALTAVAYALTFKELGELFDANLKQVALAASYHDSLGAPVGPKPALDADARRRLPTSFDNEGDFDYVTLVWDRAGALRFTSDPTASIPFGSVSGLRHVSNPSGTWHIYSIVEGGVVVQAAQRDSSRHAIAFEIAGKLFIPIAALVALISSLLVMALRRSLRSLDHAADGVARRSARTLQPIALDQLPREIHPLVRSINDLMARLSVAFANQRRFVADAAHELRTPVTALGLQLQVLKNARDAASRSRASDQLEAGVERSQRLIGQLLSLSRLEPDSFEGPPLQATAVDLSALVKEVVGHLSIKADHVGVDLGADASTPVAIVGDPEEIRVLLNNLVDNAIRHTPPGGTVDVRTALRAGCATVRVIDSGCGIPAAERERVFDRFYRGEQALGQRTTGSGLGLAIVKSIAERHHAQVSLHGADPGPGLEARVTFEAVATSLPPGSDPHR